MKKKGFTLIELLVVIAVIGVLATIVTSSLSSARIKAQDAKRIATMKQLEIALEFYYADNGDYPHLTVHTYHEGGGKSQFETALAPYIKIDLDDPLFGPYWETGDIDFRYSATSGNNYQTYGIGAPLLDLSNSSLTQNDGGNYYYWYEIGQKPKYCKDKYNGNWLFGPNGAVCQDGN